MIDIYHIRPIDIKYTGKHDDYWRAYENMHDSIDDALRRVFFVPEEFRFVQRRDTRLLINGHFRIPSARLGKANIWLNSVLRSATCEFTIDGARFEIYDDGFNMRDEV